eukprot:scaffold94532_cov75-Phaeocystis_antarctica.AAC.7
MPLIFCTLPSTHLNMMMAMWSGGGTCHPGRRPAGAHRLVWPVFWRGGIVHGVVSALGHVHAASAIAVVSVVALVCGGHAGLEPVAQDVQQVLALRAVKDDALLGVSAVLRRQASDGLLPVLIVGTLELRVAHADDAFDVEEVLVRVQPSQAAKQLSLVEEPFQMRL